MRTFTKETHLGVAETGLQTWAEGEAPGDERWAGRECGGAKYLEVACHWLGKSGSLLCGSVAAKLSEHLLAGTDTRLPPGGTEQRKPPVTSP